jgi:hypothetical protein
MKNALTAFLGKFELREIYSPVFRSSEYEPREEYCGECPVHV